MSLQDHGLFPDISADGGGVGMEVKGTVGDGGMVA